MLYFFLSYARGGDDVYVQEFFNDLCDEVRALEGLRSDEPVGFFDRGNIQPGDTWPETLVEALSECQSFLALCSPAYFLSEPCGKEWAIFQQRSREHQLRTGNSRSALIPLRWLPSRTMPEAAQVIQYIPEPRRHGARSEPHRERGIRQLLRIRRNRDDYLEFVTTVAELVVDTVFRAPIPAATDRLRFEVVPSAFHGPPQLNNVAVALPVPAAGPPPTVELTEVIPVSNKVWFVLSAPTATEAAEESLGRTNRLFYGSAPEDWTPYLPTSAEPLATFATRIAAARSLATEVAEVGELDACIDQAQRDNQIVVLLVDPWSTRMASHHEILNRYDRRADQPAAVMIPWNSEDAETRSRTPELTASVGRTFPRNMRRPHTTTFRPSVLTNETFRSDLQIVLEESRNRVIASGMLRRSLPSSTGSRPILEGP